MSIILKGIDIPKDDEEITIEISKDGLRVYSTHLKEADVEAIQIPTPHGRLIDADDIYIGRWDIDSDLAEQIQNAPTILEAER